MDASCGRGRVAPEGMNCTLTGSAQNIRSLCCGLREWNPSLFQETDFKITDGVPRSKQFKSLSIRKTNELVAYGLDGEDRAPSLTNFAGTHLEAHEYHKALSDPNVVVVDVQNAYESAIGSFSPPPGGAQLVDPKMRNSIEFPKWLAAPETKERLHNKKVLMYCTGGIRCERATALLNQMSSTDDSCKPNGVYELRGGIERYVKTFPNGGHWKGKNYLFDKRMEQVPPNKTMEQASDEIRSQCCLCRCHCTSYRGQYHCSQKLCGVPVLVCTACRPRADKTPMDLWCDLCREGYRPPKEAPDLVSQKRKADELLLSNQKNLNGNEQDGSREDANNAPATSNNKKQKHSEDHVYADRLFLSRLPLTATVSKVSDALLSKEFPRQTNSTGVVVQWLTDQNTGAFYGSCIVQMPSSDSTRLAVERGASSSGIRLDKKKIRIVFARRKLKANSNDHDDVFPPSDYNFREFPPVGC